MTDKGGGLVKKLLFPGFTDAGSNDTFRPANNGMEDITTQSDATTAIYDNRAASKPQQHEVQYDGDRVGGYAPSAATVLPSVASPARQAFDDSMNTETGAAFTHADGVNGSMEKFAEEPLVAGSSSSRTARLFPSTDPSASNKPNNNSSKSNSVDNNSQAPGPASPPAMVRRAAPDRSLSTRAFVGGSLSVSPRTMPFPTTSPRVRPVEPLIDQETESSLEQSSMALTSANSGVVSSVLGYHFLDQTNDENGGEDSTPVKSNVSRKESDDTPETRPLTLETLREMDPQREAGEDGMSDVGSNISEYGTVIEAPSRLAEVQAMAALVESKENSQKASPLTPMKEEEIDSPNTGDELEKVELSSSVAGLALPSLDSKPRDDIEELPKPLLLSSSPRSLKENEEQNMHSPTAVKNEAASGKEAGQADTSASAMVTAAFRRLGSGVGSLSQTMRSPIPTPTPGTTAPPPTPPTPRPDYSRRKSNDALPSSFLLRSPGSSAHFMSHNTHTQSNRSNPTLSPRYPSFRTTQKSQSGRLRHASSLASPLRFARGCLSFDPSMEDNSGVPHPIPEENSSKSVSSGVAEKSQDVRGRCKSWDAGSSVLAAPGQDGPFSSRDFRSFRLESLTSPGRSNASAFRVHANGEESQILHQSDRVTQNFATTKDTSTPNRNMMRNAFSPPIVNTKNAIPLRTPNRIEIERDDALDILACLVQRSAEFQRENDESSTDSPTRKSPVHEEDNETKDAQSIPPEKPPESTGRVEEVKDGDSLLGETGGKSTPDIKGDKFIGNDDGGSTLSQSGAPDLTEAVRLLREISERHQEVESNRSEASAKGIDHEGRMSAIDELLRSHTYASEMKRAASSASAWLRSIGRDESSAQEKRSTSSMNGPVDESTQGRGEGTVQSNDDAPPSPTSSAEKMDLIALKALLHAAEMKSQEKDEAVQRLNDELSKCRAEIGRLKTSSRAEVLFTSPNRSILDNESTTSSEEASKVHAEVGALGELADDASPILEASGEVDTSVDESFLQSEVGAENVEQNEHHDWEALAQAKREVLLLKASLAKANDMVKKLQTNSVAGNQSEEEERDDNIDTLVVDTNHPELEKELDDYKQTLKKVYEAEALAQAGSQKVSKSKTDMSSSPDKRTINVRMLDGENFITEWDELAPPLPPPPDHGLRSPIVKDLLEQWTADASMHDSLLSWMDRVLEGADPRSIPPLTISSLNHQARDGFTMHVLPLLLRRSDIHVEVTTRAHRMTTYDMAVMVSSSMPLAGAGDDQSQPSSNSNAYAAQRTDKKQIMAFKASHGDNPVVEAPVEINSGATGTVSDYLRVGSFSRSFETGSDSVAHSAITAQITNSARTRPLLPRPQTASRGSDGTYENDSDQFASLPASSLMGDEWSVGSSISRSSSQRSTEQQSGLMSTIGGALGLLSRRKPGSNQASLLQSASYDDEGWNNESTSRGVQRSGSTPHEDVPSFLRPPQSPHGANWSSSAFPPRGDDENQPYHRVVSAPPGRIGVTFVEYRGHAVVSDVARESPLSGWVFPSDILIAIDEVPVSGMRVRDIVNILTGRKERQRALRVISSHAMNEALNASAISEVNAG